MILVHDGLLAAGVVGQGQGVPRVAVALAADEFLGHLLVVTDVPGVPAALSGGVQGGVRGLAPRRPDPGGTSPTPSPGSRQPATLAGKVGGREGGTCLRTYAL